MRWPQRRQTHHTARALLGRQRTPVGAKLALNAMSSVSGGRSSSLSVSASARSEAAAQRRRTAAGITPTGPSLTGAGGPPIATFASATAGGGRGEAPLQALQAAALAGFPQTTSHSPSPSPSPLLSPGSDPSSAGPHRISGPGGPGGPGAGSYTWGTVECGVSVTIPEDHWDPEHPDSRAGLDSGLVLSEVATGPSASGMGVVGAPAGGASAAATAAAAAGSAWEEETAGDVSSRRWWQLAGSRQSSMRSARSRHTGAGSGAQPHPLRALRVIPTLAKHTHRVSSSSLLAFGVCDSDTEEAADGAAAVPVHHVPHFHHFHRIHHGTHHHASGHVSHGHHPSGWGAHVALGPRLGGGGATTPTRKGRRRQVTSSDDLGLNGFLKSLAGDKAAAPEDASTAAATATAAAADAPAAAPARTAGPPPPSHTNSFASSAHPPPTTAEAPALPPPEAFAAALAARAAASSSGDGESSGELRASWLQRQPPAAAMYESPRAMATSAENSDEGPKSQASSTPGGGAAVRHGSWTEPGAPATFAVPPQPAARLAAQLGPRPKPAAVVAMPGRAGGGVLAAAPFGSTAGGGGLMEFTSAAATIHLAATLPGAAATAAAASTAASTAFAGAAVEAEAEGWRGRVVRVSGVGWGWGPARVGVALKPQAARAAQPVPAAPMHLAPAATAPASLAPARSLPLPPPLPSLRSLPLPSPQPRPSAAPTPHALESPNSPGPSPARSRLLLTSAAPPAAAAAGPAPRRSVGGNRTGPGSIASPTVATMLQHRLSRTCLAPRPASACSLPTVAAMPKSPFVAEPATATSTEGGGAVTPGAARRALAGHSRLALRHAGSGRLRSHAPTEDDSAESLAKLGSEFGGSRCGSEYEKVLQRYDSVARGTGQGEGLDRAGSFGGLVDPAWGQNEEAPLFVLADQED
ncbi:hypothetical protein HYH03_011168 [Edaphochlamys debaryana]|uniref:Uncharacterized protein n=1 Tax=Edaphochlamys debaryana TaxID=47281 RepID=A0A835XUI1_9CHLO|nr:hypothetical protein HYH03_011168 [Edaphochlamys debaryana]|eukprot:KAG2490366.1 hypothetical protein HYH03_011168 [Edaphochlamys debaryana]